MTLVSGDITSGEMTFGRPHGYHTQKAPAEL